MEMEHQSDHYGAPGEESIDIRRYLRIAWKKKLWIILPTVLGILCSLLYASYYFTFHQENYRSYATIVFRGGERILGQLGDYVVDGGARLGAVQNEIYSAPFLERVAVNLGLDLNPDMQASAEELRAELSDVPYDQLLRRVMVGHLRSGILVESGEGDKVRGSTTIFRVVATSGSPDETVGLADAVANLFIEQKRSEQLQSIRSAGEFVVDQLTAYRRRLEESEGKLREFETMMAMKRGLTDTSRFSLMARVERIRADVDVEIGRAEEARKDLMSEIKASRPLNGIYKKLLRDKEVAALKERLLRNESELGDLLLKETWRDPAVILVNETIHRCTEDIQSRVVALISSDHPDLPTKERDTLAQVLRLEIGSEGIKKRRTRVQAYIDEFYRAQGQLASEQTTLARLREQADSDRSIYPLFLQQSAAPQLTETMENTRLGGKYEVIETAQKPLEPFNKPNEGRIVLMGTFLGLVVGLGLVFVFESLDTSLKTVQEAERYLQLPILGNIPHLKRPNRKKRRLALAVGFSLFLLTLGGSAAISVKYPQILDLLKAKLPF